MQLLAFFRGDNCIKRTIYAIVGPFSSKQLHSGCRGQCFFECFACGFENNPCERSQKMECTFFLDFSAKIAQKGRFMQFLGLF